MHISCHIFALFHSYYRLYQLLSYLPLCCNSLKGPPYAMPTFANCIFLLLTTTTASPPPHFPLATYNPSCFLHPNCPYKRGQLLWASEGCTRPRIIIFATYLLREFSAPLRPRSTTHTLPRRSGGKAMLRKTVAKEGRDWDRLLPYRLFAYCEVPQDSPRLSYCTAAVSKDLSMCYGRQVRRVSYPTY